MATGVALIQALAQTAPNSQPSGDGQWMVYAVIAFGMALALVVLEAFVPSGGVLGILAGICAIAGVFCFFRFDTTWGMVSMVVSLLALPFVIAGMLWLWPNTPVGRWLTLEENQQRSVPEGLRADTGDGAGVRVGDEGEALSDLRPVGVCKLAGKRIDCIAHAGLIERGSRVRVVHVEGPTVKVKAV